MGKRRPSGDGLVRKRADGRWEGRIVVGHKENGNPIYRSVFAEKQSDLMPRLNELKMQYAGVELTEESSITLGEWLGRWLEEYKKPILRQSTYSGSSKDIENHILPYLGTKKLTQLKTADIQKHYNRLLESGRKNDIGKGNGLANATVRGIHMVLREALDSAVREGLIPRNPADGTSPPKDPSACRKALARILKRAGCEHVPFHAMRHTFASNAFYYGMDVKTLASTIGHESVETTLNVYAHSSEQMKRDAAKKIDEAIGTVLGADVTASEASCGDENGEAQEPTNDTDKPKTVEFKPYQPKYRKRGTGSVHQVSKNVWEGRYTPTVNGKRIARNIYADSEEECEVKLEVLIKEMKAEFGIR